MSWNPVFEIIFASLPWCPNHGDDIDQNVVRDFYDER